MTRKEEIKQAARQKEKEVGFTQIVLDVKGVNSAYGIGFLEGAQWADEHPDIEAIKAIEDHAYFAGSEAMREKIINKASEWLYEQLNKGKMESGDIGAFLENFKKAMNL